MKDEEVSTNLFSRDLLGHLASCKSQKKPDRSNKSINEMECYLSDSISSTKDIEATPIAPKGISYKIKLSFERSLSIAAFENIIHNSGISFIKFLRNNF